MSLEQIDAESRSHPFAGFRCWSDHDATRVLDREAAAASRELLLATHVAPPLRKVSATAGAFRDVASATQDEVLEVLRSSTADSMVVPIIGTSGSGKSHLVLWLREMLRESADESRHRVIYVPKGKTSLGGVIELILDGYEGGAFDTLRDDVRKASASMDDRERALRLRNDLAIHISQADPGARGPERSQHRQFVAQNLPALLNDAVYEERLLSTGGALQRVVAEATQGENDLPAEFGAADLPVDLTVREQEQLGSKAREFLRNLGHPSLLETTIEMLNECRDRALSQIFGVSPMQLLAVFEDLRRQILKEAPQQRLLLMLEDFTLLQGIQHDLLEAMIANARPGTSDDLELAPMTTVMAVTSNFLSKVFTSVGGDTVRTRIEDHGHIYSMDSPYDAADVGYDRELVRTFVGKYLNAVRVGADAVRTERSGVPNACGACHHRDRCISGFGSTDEDEYGLYPLNGHAIDRMVRSRKEDFNPRDMLAMLQQTLTSHGQDLADGRFPSSHWANLFNPRDHGRQRLKTLGLDVQRTVDTTPNSEQRSILLTFWGGVPDAIGNLDPAIHEAFQIPPISGQPIRPASDEGRETVAKDNRTAGDTDTVADTVQRWRDGDRLSADESREVRRFVAEAVLGAFDSESALTAKSLVDRCFQPQRDVVIDGGQGGGGTRTHQRFTVKVGRDPAGVYLVEGILRAINKRAATAHRVQSADWGYDDGPNHLAALLNFGARGAESLAEYIREQAASERQERETVLCGLLFSGVVLGLGDPGSAEGMLAAVYREPRHREWQHLPERVAAVYKRLDQQRSTVQSFAFEPVQVRKGISGSGLGIDPTDVLQTLRAFSANWDLASAEEGSHAHALVSLLQEHLEPALDETREFLIDWSEATSPLVGTSTEWPATAKTIQEIIDAARGYYGGSPRGGGGDQVSSRDVAAAVSGVNDLLDGWESLTIAKRGQGIARLPWARLGQVRAQVEALETSLERTRDKARASIAEDGGKDALSLFDQSLRAFEQELVQLTTPATTDE